MTKIRQYVSFVMAVIIMNSAFNPYSVYADELSSESEIEQSETEIESVTEAESELESETASGADTELENDGIYNDAEYIDDLMINDIAVYANSRPTGDGREPSGGSLSGGGHRPTRSSGGHSVSGNTTASQTINNIVVNFSTDLRNDVEDIANFVENIRYKLGSINNNIIDVLGYQYDIFVYVQKVYNEVVDIDARAVEIRNILQKFETDIFQIKSFTSMIDIDTSNMFEKMKEMYKSLSSIDTSVTSIDNFLSVTLVSTLRSLRTELNSYLVDADNTTLAGSVRDIRLVLRTIKSYLIDAENVSLAESIRDIRKVLRTVKDSVNNIYNQVEKLKTNFTSALSADGKWFTTIFIEKIDELISAVKNLNQKIVIVDNTDRTKSDDEEENASLFDLVTMIMYSVFILASLLDLLLLLLEYVVLMFQIPAVPALMNENVLLGWNYANAICIPGTQFSIVSFLRLLMYITVIFSAIRVIKKAIDNGSIGVI
ncbi:putative uncharacterized protein [Firmicutes bacterium CAG:882]|nr:putative uncharacterized protein [Firmicutes bacterium CAG:882]